LEGASGDRTGWLVRSRLVGQRTAVINQIRGFLGITVRQGPVGLRQALPSILAQRTGELSPLLLRLLEDLVDDWRWLDERTEDITTQIETLAKEDENAGASWERLGSDR
jgi:hypothetical protein